MIAETPTAMPTQERNIHSAVVEGFGDQWSRFDQKVLSDAEVQKIFGEYFDIFPWRSLPPNAVGFDAGCGSGRWARLVAPRVSRLHCFDASQEVVAVAREMLAGLPNCEVVHAAIDELPIADGSMDFGYSLGVLHHIPDTPAALRDCVSKLKSGAPFLLYLYHRFDNRPRWYRTLWRMSELLRYPISRSPKPIRYLCSQILAATVYWPLSRVAKLAERVGISPDSFPLSFYRNRSYYVLRTDALDRFGTRLEQRFTRAEIEEMMHVAGLDNIVFSDHAPFWCAVGWRR
jgi:SAM-dependent methyltransferase